MHTYWISGCILLFSGIVYAQDAPSSTITSTGESTEKASPTHVFFRLTASFEENTLVNSTEKANFFPEHFKETLNEHKLNTSEITFRLPHVPSVNGTLVIVQGMMRFTLPSGANREEQIAKYATLCDAVATLGKATDTILQGPTLVVENADLFEQETLKRATENALYKADAIAQILNTRIYEVKSVEVLELRWHSDGEDPGTAPGLDGLMCSAKVSLTYLHQP